MAPQARITRVGTVSAGPPGRQATPPTPPALSPCRGGMDIRDRADKKTQKAAGKSLCWKDVRRPPDNAASLGPLLRWPTVRDPRRHAPRESRLRSSEHPLHPQPAHTTAHTAAPTRSLREKDAQPPPDNAVGLGPLLRWPTIRDPRPHAPRESCLRSSMLPLCVALRAAMPVNSSSLCPHLKFDAQTTARVVGLPCFGDVP
ncbi:MAG: hypothetical protein BJ554DRAFT_2470, partial [Olpidium bornovanus]